MLFWIDNWYQKHFHNQKSWFSSNLGCYGLCVLMFTIRFWNMMFCHGSRPTSQSATMCWFRIMLLAKRFCIANFVEPVSIWLYSSPDLNLPFQSKTPRAPTPASIFSRLSSRRNGPRCSKTLRLRVEQLFEIILNKLFWYHEFYYYPFALIGLFMNKEVLKVATIL